MDNLKNKAAKGLMWGIVNSGTTQLLNAVFGIFLGRLLCPEDYGIVGMITIFTVLAGNLQDSGFSTALINLKNPTHKDYNSVFWFSISMSIVLYITLYFCAPLISNYYNEPRLTDVSRFIFLTFVISSTGIVHSAWMFRRMMTKEKAIVTTISLIISGVVGIILAYNKYSYWSLAWQQIVFNLVFNIGRFYYTKWHPTLSFSLKPIRKMFGFSYKILIPTMINSFSQNVLVFIFGRIFNATVVGNFSQAFKWNTMAHSFVSNSFSQIAQPVFVETRNDYERQKRAFIKMLRFTAFVCFPALFGLALVSEEFIIIALTNKWKDCVPLLEILCISGAFMPFYIIYQNLVISLNKGSVYMLCNVAQIIVIITGILFSYKQGLEYSILVYSVINILWIAVWQMMSQSFFKFSIFKLIKTISPFLTVAIVTMVITYLVTININSIYLRFIAKIITATITYIILMRIVDKEIVKEIVNYFVKNKR